jgi:hypothetical protein
MTLSVPSARALDLRVERVDDVLERVEKSLHVRLDRNSVVRKRRSIGARTHRGTWVRIERRSLARVGSQGWDGIECAEALRGVSKPA